MTKETIFLITVGVITIAGLLGSEILNKVVGADAKTWHIVFILIIFPVFVLVLGKFTYILLSDLL